MDSRTAVNLLRSAIRTRGETWADFGAADGVFTRALAEILGGGSRIYAIERDVCSRTHCTSFAPPMRCSGNWWGR